MLLLLFERWFGRQGSAAAIDHNGTPLEDIIAEIQQGNEQLRNDFIRQYQPFIAKTTSRFCKRFIDPQRDDEFSVALTAFDEAITGYSPSGGSRFLSFAEKVIVRRLIDHVRKEQRQRTAIPYSAFQGDEEQDAPQLLRAEIREAFNVYDRERSADERREEITALTEELARYGVTFNDLTQQSPKHQDSRETLLAIGRRLAGHSVLFESLRQKKQLPVKELCEAEQVSRKTIERHRKYLIAVSLIANGRYPYLQEYIELSRNGKEEAAT